MLGIGSGTQKNLPSRGSSLNSIQARARAVRFIFSTGNLQAIRGSFRESRVKHGPRSRFSCNRLVDQVPLTSTGSPAISADVWASAAAALSTAAASTTMTRFIFVISGGRKSQLELHAHAHCNVLGCAACNCNRGEPLEARKGNPHDPVYIPLLEHTDRIVAG